MEEKLLRQERSKGLKLPQWTNLEEA
ncbi:uncharacterized protein G2W53_043893 [Senna tora]|uniref:Uncharacterized protein n=1 Tax=Senna tora TaxID=362788 RepID=A0A834SPL9_9FABA|nr:uncharacterized protein G2W53_043893 [Senna tora]